MSARSLLRVAAIPTLALSGLVGGAASGAPVPFGGNRYDLVLDNDISWTGAQGAANSAGGNLAVISSPAEQTFIESLLLDRNAPTGSYWFGLQESDAEGVYRTLDDSPGTFSNFSANEPNDAGGLGENFGAIYWTADGGDPALLARRGDWNDLPDEGYPNGGVLTPGQADLFRAGYLVEFAGVGSDNGGGPGDGDGGGPGDGDGGGDPNAIPIPPALLLFPGTAFLAMVAARRMKR